MRKSLRFPIFAASAFAALCPLNAPAAGSAWTYGVSRDSGWNDVNKTGNGDSSMCWAAQSADMLGYWQSLYVASGNALPAGAPGGSGEIYEYFTSNWSNKGGNALIAIPWYMTGDFISGYEPYDESTQLNEGADSAGFFSGLYPTVEDLFAYDETHNPTGDFQVFWYEEKSSPDCFYSYSAFSSILISKLSGNSVVGLGLTLSTGTLSGGHSVTLWGCDYDDSGLVTTIYITDSDDNWTGIRPVALSGDDSGIYLTDYQKNPEISVSVSKFSALSVERFLAQIPEPSAFGLLAGTLALALVSARRRRKIS
ncbi:MAG: IdeS/Mac family cysteine endopeptidase [Candidatus Spyradosoma sp.]